jgi:hypothetical protein
MKMPLFGVISFLKASWLPLRLIRSRCKPNPAIVLGDDGILKVMTSMEVLPWSSIYMTFGSVGVDGSFDLGSHLW